MKIDDFKNAVISLGINIDEDKLEKLNIYYEELIAYNEHTNVTGITLKEDVYLKHFYDSLMIAKAIDLNNISTMIDIGSGAGFPGVVLKIFFPNIELTLLDSNNKKTKFLEIICNKLDLKNVQIINDRAENYAINHLNEYDLCVSRAVAFVDIIASISIPFIKKDGKVVLMKGSFENELNVLQNHLNELNIKLFNIIEYNLPGLADKRNLIVIEKNSITSKIMSYSQIIKRNKKWNV